MRSELPFDFEMPLHVFEKADAGVGKTRRIGGVASLDSDDRHQEVVLQSGLNWQDFNKNGWFNDNHSKKTVDILGYPDGPARYFRKGQALPSGDKAKANCHWVEGYLLDTPKADEVWELGKALAKTHRRLGLSVEGKIFRRQGLGNKVIAEALVRNVAITNCPVHPDAKMEVLAKSLLAVEHAEPDELEKALTMGVATPGVGVATQGPQSGPGAGKVLVGQSLEHGAPRPRLDAKEDEEKEKAKKATVLTKSEAFAWVRARMPRATPDQIERFLKLTRTAKRAGNL
jgi:hypothetical protein